MPQASIVGTGLIGASVGLGLSAAGWQVVGWDPDPDVLRVAVARGAVAAAGASFDELLGHQADLIVLAAPPAAVVAVLRTLDTEALVTDVAGVKGPLVEAGRHLPHFVPGHPMAGREMSGPAAASGALFRGAAWVLVTDNGRDADLLRMEETIRLLGARPLRMSAADHDAAVAVISHLPQVLAAALVRHATDSTNALNLAAGSFRDLTRVAASNPSAWAELLTANSGRVAGSLRSFAERLNAWASAIEDGRRDDVEDALSRARDTRAALAPPVVAVGVALADRPGELAKVGRALEASHADIRDLQLRHAPHGGGGLLSLFVRPGEAEALEEALEAEGLVIAR